MVDLGKRWGVGVSYVFWWIDVKDVARHRGSGQQQEHQWLLRQYGRLVFCKTWVIWFSPTVIFLATYSIQINCTDYGLTLHSSTIQHTQKHMPKRGDLATHHTPNKEQITQKDYKRQSTASNAIYFQFLMVCFTWFLLSGRLVKPLCMATKRQHRNVVHNWAKQKRFVTCMLWTANFFRSRVNQIQGTFYSFLETTIEINVEYCQF